MVQYVLGVYRGVNLWGGRRVERKRKEGGGEGGEREGGR